MALAELECVSVLEPVMEGEVLRCIVGDTEHNAVAVCEGVAETVAEVGLLALLDAEAEKDRLVDDVAVSVWLALAVDDRRTVGVEDVDGDRLLALWDDERVGEPDAVGVDEHDTVGVSLCVRLSDSGGERVAVTLCVTEFDALCVGEPDTDAEFELLGRDSDGELVAVGVAVHEPLPVRLLDGLDDAMRDAVREVLRVFVAEPVPDRLGVCVGEGVDVGDAPDPEALSRGDAEAVREALTPSALRLRLRV